MPISADGLVIRRATMADTKAMAEYMTAVMGEGLDTIPRRGPRSEELQCSLLEKAAANGRTFFLMAFDGEKIVAFVEVHFGDDPSNDHAAWLGVTVAKEWRGKGLGRRIMKAAIAAAKAVPGACRIELLCVSWNTSAVELYKSLGFTIEGVKRKAVNFRGKPEDEYLMALVW